MDCPAWGIPISYCKTGAKLARKEGTVCAECYADPKRGTFGFPATRAKLERNYEGLFHPKWVPASIRQIGWYGHERMRWLMSGDLQGVTHLRNIIRVCLETPWVMHWLPTREKEAVLACQDELPDNLTIRASGTVIDGKSPAWWPTTSTVVTEGATCPSSVKGGNCGEHGCVRCWDPSAGVVSYLKHQLPPRPGSSLGSASRGFSD